MVTLKDFEAGKTAIMTGGYRKTGYEEVMVNKVGRKYVTVAVNGWREIRFAESRYHNYALHEVTVYGSGRQLYPTLESYLKKVEHDRLVDWGEKTLPTLIKELSTEQISNVKEIIEEDLKRNGVIWL